MSMQRKSGRAARFDYIARKIYRQEELSSKEGMELLRRILTLEATLSFLRSEIRFANGKVLEQKDRQERTKNAQTDVGSANETLCSLITKGLI